MGSLREILKAFLGYNKGKNEMKTKCFFVNLIFVFGFLTQQIFAELPKMMCMTEFPTTSMMVVPNNNSGESPTLTLKVFHHNGVQFLPLHHGLITPHDLNLLMKHSELLRSMGEYYELEVRGDRCLSLDTLNFYCPGSVGDRIVNGQKVNVWSVSAGEMTEKNYAGTYSYHLISLNMTVNGENLYMTMKYDNSTCTNQFSEFKFLKQSRLNQIR